MGGMNNRCKVCGTVLDPEGEGVRICPCCKGASHDECWAHLGGCIDPECRKAAKAERGGPEDVSLGSRRQGALIRRRLAWIVAQEMGMASDYHPDEQKYAFATIVCSLVFGYSLVKGIPVLTQIFGPAAVLLVGLLALHRRQRRRGLIHRWIPAGSAPERALQLADWLLFVDGGGSRGRPAPQFHEDYIHGDSERGLFEEARGRRVLDVASVGGEGKLHLGEVGGDWVHEARRRAAPMELTRA